MEKKRLDYTHKREAYKLNTCNKIINELFKKE